MLRTLNHSEKQILMDIPVQVFNNCSEQWPKCWEHCKELEKGTILTVAWQH
jgi:hypothetical protein